MLSNGDNACPRRTLRMAGQVAVLKSTNSFRDKFERYIARNRHNAYLRRKAYCRVALLWLPSVWQEVSDAR